MRGSDGYQMNTKNGADFSTICCLDLNMGEWCWHFVDQKFKERETTCEGGSRVPLEGFRALLGSLHQRCPCLSVAGCHRLCVWDNSASGPYCLAPGASAVSSFPSCGTSLLPVVRASVHLFTLKPYLGSEKSASRVWEKRKRPF